MATQKQYVYLFKDAYGKGKELLGGKGAGLAEMAHIGITIPMGFTVTTEACNLYYEEGKKVPEFLKEQIFKGLADLEKETGKKFGGDPKDRTVRPLLVSVRSGARVSMPGMMDTILNLGLNDETVEILAEISNNPRFAYDCYRRFILMFTNIAKGIKRDDMDAMLEKVKEEKGYKYDYEITAEELKVLCGQFKDYYKKQFGEEFPQDPKVQLLEAVTAIFRSWDNPRANTYRKMNGIPYSWGTAVNVQMMAFGNLNNNSGTGVGFSRSPATGENHIFAEYLINAQGEDVVAGIRTPLSIEALKEQQPEVYEQLIKNVHLLENHYKDMQDMEFTVEDGKLYFLQTRNGKRTAAAGLKIAVDLHNEGLITKEEALLRVEAKSLDALLHPTFSAEAIKAAKVIAQGLPASPGAAVGKLAFSAEEAKERGTKGEKVILVRAETSPEDLDGMVAAQGILTMRGGMTSHAAVVARGMGKTCITGCGAAHISEENRTMEIDGKVYTDKDTISINGSTGEVYLGAVETQEASLSGNFGTIMEWADEVKRLSVRANADTPRDALQAVKFGANGIGLCRTEHMFFNPDKIFHFRKMILANTVEEREAALAELLPLQQKDFYALFMAMKDKNVNIRLLDPPLHEFLPQEEGAIAELAKAIGTTSEAIHKKIEELHEFNPMMGHRGCRLDVTYPEIGRMQTRAILQAALQAQHDLEKAGEKVKITPEIMIPLTLDPKEFKFVKKIIDETAQKVLEENHSDMTYYVGTMIEIPRAALLAGEIAKDAKFFSFGTNDLTQMTFGFSRDDATKFLPAYYDTKILEFDPFQTLDVAGVGQLVVKATHEGKAANPELHVGVCGETGGDPASIEFYHAAGLDYVSCSPFRVPVARLAAAQAAAKEKLRK